MAFPRKYGRKTVSSQAAGRNSKAVYACEHCGWWSDGEKPAQCPDCGRIALRRIHSKAEARRWSSLRLLQQTGHIADLELQPVFPLHVIGPNGERVQIAKAIMDFRYKDIASNSVVVEDVKGVQDSIGLLKRKHVEAQYGITVRLPK